MVENVISLSDDEEAKINEDGSYQLPPSQTYVMRERP